MAKKSKRGKGLSNFFFHTRLGFYILILASIIGFTTTINSLKSVDNESDLSVLAANDNRGKSEEAKQQKEAVREIHKQELEQKFNVQSEGLKVEFKPESNKITKQAKHDTQQLDLGGVESDLVEEVEEAIEDAEDVDIATSGGDIIIGKNKVKARTGFPLTIDVSTGQLIVTRPDGTQKIVTVLPDQAIQNFLRHKKVEIIGQEPPDDEEDDEEEDETGTDSAEAEFVGIQSVDEEVDETETESETEIEIVERNDQLVYEIKGKKKIRILGLIPAETTLTGYVSTETGEVVDESQSIFDRLLNLISIQQ